MPTERHLLRRARSRGYVLLVVIAVSVLVITVLGTLAKTSLRRGLEAADAERSLQQRWGSYTLQKALLEEAPQIFEARDEITKELMPGQAPPPSVIRAVLTLRGVTFDMLLADEDAKLNLNAYYHRQGPQQTRQAVTGVAGAPVTLALRLTPATTPLLANARLLAGGQGGDDEDIEVIPDAFRSWGEVFDIESLSSQLGSDAALPNLTTAVTCWGTGQLNIQRASDQAILAVAGSVVQDGGAQRLLKRYRDSRVPSLTTLLQTEITSPRNRQQLAELLSESSTNFSIWIDASTRGRPSVRTFTVMQRDDEGVTRQTKFVH